MPCAVFGCNKLIIHPLLFITRNHLRKKATNSAKIHSLARKYKHLRINQIQLPFLQFNQDSITFLGIHIRH